MSFVTIKHRREASAFRGTVTFELPSRKFNEQVARKGLELLAIAMPNLEIVFSGGKP